MESMEHFFKMRQSSYLAPLPVEEYLLIDTCTVYRYTVSKSVERVEEATQMKCPKKESEMITKWIVWKEILCV